MIRLAEGTDFHNALLELNRKADVLYAEPNYIQRISAEPDDPRFDELWGLHNTGQTGGTPGADIGALEAWSYATGSRDVVVAVIDTGVDYTHEDLADNMWINPRGGPDLHGYDFVNDRPDPMDDHGHGTHCAGTIGAVGNNRVGVVGVNWEVSIMALKFLDAGGSGQTADAISCIEYAIENGAHVLNNSWGGGGYSQALKDMIDAAGAANILFVAAAGNDGRDNDQIPHYPASYDSENVLSVMATDHHDRRSAFSCYGAESVHLGAPGSAILSAVTGGGYASWNGTSMATPHVAGAAALMLAHTPGITALEIKDILLDTVDETTPPLVCVSGGRMNLARAMGELPTAWLNVTPDFAEDLPPGERARLAVLFDAGELEPGTYEADIILRSNDRYTPTTNIPCVMIVQPDALDISPADAFRTEGPVRGPFEPGEFHYVLFNQSEEPLPWTASNTSAWLHLSSQEGTLAPGESLELPLSLVPHTATNLLPGIHGDTLVFRNEETGARLLRHAWIEVTPPPPTRLHEFSFEDDPGWSTEGGWAFGRPEPKGGNPASGFRGTNVYGYNLAGRYPNNMPAHYLTSPPFDCTGFESIRLVFRRWLGVEGAPRDHAGIEASVDGETWTPLWANTSGSMQDTTWQLVDYPLPEKADNASSIQIRWSMGPSDDYVTYSGWNIDEIAIYGHPAEPFAISPEEDFSSEGELGGPFDPPHKTYLLTNAGTASLAWSTDWSASWLLLSPASGTLEPGEATEVLATLATEVGTLSAGLYEDVIHFNNQETGASFTRQATLEIHDRVLDHFTWEFPEPVHINTPHPVTIRAANKHGRLIETYEQPAGLSAFTGPVSPPQRIVGYPEHQGQIPANNYAYGLRFTPTNDLHVTHIRRYWGHRVSIWAETDEALLLRQAVTGEDTQWTEIEMAPPLTLHAGASYRVVVSATNALRYWSEELPETFAHGHIDGGCRGPGDDFPAENNTLFHMVDLRYRVGEGSPLPITPTRTDAFTHGIWTGSITFAQAADNVHLQAVAEEGPYGLSDTFEIHKLTADILLDELEHTYDRTPHAASVQTDPPDLAYSLTYNSQTNPPTRAGTYALLVVIDDPVYQGETTSTLTIAQAPLGVKELTGNDKVYDRTRDATASGTASLEGVMAPDAVQLAGTPTFRFVSATVGTNIEITVSGYTLTGADHENYTLVQPTLNADITPRNLTITNLVGDNKIYDRTRDATASGTASLEGVVSPDDVALAGTPTFRFVSATVGTNIAITTSGYTLDGANHRNYTLTQPTLTADITPRELTVINAVAQDKIYDGTTAALIEGATLQGVLPFDSVHLVNAATGTFAQATSGTSIPVTSYMRIEGPNAANYMLTLPLLYADITGYRIQATHEGHGTLSPTGEIYVEPKGYLSFVLTADPGHYIGDCFMYDTVVEPGAAGLLEHRFELGPIDRSGTFHATFLNIANDTAQHKTPVTWLREHYPDATDMTSLRALATNRSASGMFIWEEFIGGTDPTKADDFFRMAAIQRTSRNAIRINWSPAVTGRLYSIYWTDTLRHPIGPPSNVVEQLTQPTDSWTVSNENPVAAGFYHVEVQLDE